MAGSSRTNPGEWCKIVRVNYRETLARLNNSSFFEKTLLELLDHEWEILFTIHEWIDSTFWNFRNNPKNKIMTFNNYCLANHNWLSCTNIECVSGNIFEVIVYLWYATQRMFAGWVKIHWSRTEVCLFQNPSTLVKLFFIFFNINNICFFFCN